MKRKVTDRPGIEFLTSLFPFFKWEFVGLLIELLTTREENNGTLFPHPFVALIFFLSQRLLEGVRPRIMKLFFRPGCPQRITNTSERFKTKRCCGDVHKELPTSQDDSRPNAVLVNHLAEKSFKPFDRSAI